MSKTPPVRPYQWLAEYYDQIFTFHASWFEAAHQRVLGPIMPHVESACDLCCGTGRTAIELARQGIRMYAVDLSPGMCRAARRKARVAGVPLRVIRADMRSFRLPEPVDLILSESDAVNHVPERSDLPLVAASVAAALRPGGHFFFDLNNRLAFEKVWPLTWFIEKRGVAAVMHGGSDGDRAWSDVEWFIREGKLWRRHHEHVEEVCWTAAEVRQAFHDAGFDRVRSWDATPFFEDNPMTRRGYRTFYLARKAMA